MLSSLYCAALISVSSLLVELLLASEWVSEWVSSMEVRQGCLALLPVNPPKERRGCRVTHLCRASCSLCFFLFFDLLVLAWVVGDGDGQSHRRGLAWMRLWQSNRIGYIVLEWSVVSSIELRQGCLTLLPVNPSRRGCRVVHLCWASCSVRECDRTSYLLRTWWIRRMCSFCICFWYSFL